MEARLGETPKAARVTYIEAAAETKLDQIPLSHLSIEVGHIYMDDLINGVEQIRAQFRRVAPRVRAHTELAREEYGPTARVSTCFLIDDYFGAPSKPTDLIDQLLAVAQECDLRIDYLAREAACAIAPTYRDGEYVAGADMDLAAMVSECIVVEPDIESNGRRPPTVETGWLCNGRRSTANQPTQAMRVERYRPPEEFGCREHSVFLDVQLWSENAAVDGCSARWSCPYLAAIWLLLRLGMLRFDRKAVIEPVRWSEDRAWPQRWRELPAVIQLNPHAKPFAAYRALSILPQRYVGVEHAVRVILDHIALDEGVIEQTVARAAAEGITLPRLAPERIGHLLLDGS